LDDETGGVDLSPYMNSGGIDAKLTGELSRNFTGCIELYTVCLSSGNSIGHDLCKKAFDKCSIDILLESHIDEVDLTEEVEGGSGIEGLDDEDQSLAGDLYDCIRAYTRCLDDTKRRLGCMKTYNDCSIAAMEKSRKKKKKKQKENPVPGIIARRPPPGSQNEPRGHDGEYAWFKSFF
jgi:hypothetical protein